MANCQITPMAEQSTNNDNQKDVTNIIPEGRVGQVCKEWLVREDGNLAYRLQNEEIVQHYNENRSKNQIVRKDIPLAKHLQQNEILEAQEKYERMLKNQLEHDERMARKIERRLWLEEEAAKRAAEEADEKLAKKLMEKEKAKQLKKRLEKEKQQVEKLSAQICADYSLEQPSSSNQSCGPTTLERFAKPSYHRIMTEDEQELDLSEFCMPPPPGLTPEELKLFLEEQDAEIARLLQNQELKRNRNPEKEKLALIEAQDFEIAKMLQKMEKERYKRIKEKLRNQRRIGRDQDSNFQNELQDYNYQRTSTPLNTLQTTPVVHNKIENEYDIPENHLVESTTSVLDQTYEEPYNVFSNQQTETKLAQSFHNIAIDLDPTYKRRSKTSSSQGNLVESCVDDEERNHQESSRIPFAISSTTSSSRSSHSSDRNFNNQRVLSVSPTNTDNNEYAPPLPPRDVSLMSNNKKSDQPTQNIKRNRSPGFQTNTNLLPPHHPLHPNRQYNNNEQTFITGQNTFIQGQRRVGSGCGNVGLASSMEKQKSKSKHQDGCKTQ